MRCSRRARRPTRKSSNIVIPPRTATIATVQKNAALKLANKFRTEFMRHPEVGLRGTSKRLSRTHANSCALTTNEWFAVSRRFGGKCKLVSPQQRVFQRSEERR